MESSFDFTRKDGELWFLELIPNGQWAWLDEKNEHGLVSLVADAIRREDRALLVSVLIYEREGEI